MKRQVIFALLASLTASAYAGSTVTAITTDIDDSINSLISSLKSPYGNGPSRTDWSKPLLDLNYQFDAYNDHLVLYTNWKKTAEFPKPAQSGTFDSTIYKYSQDGVSINSTKDRIEIKANDFDKILEHLNGKNPEIPLLNQSGYMYPNLKMDPYSYSVSFNLESMEFYGPFNYTPPLKAGEKLSEMSVNTGTVIAYRVANGELKPIVHDLTVYDYDELKTAEHFFIYAKAGKGAMKLSTAAIEINKPQGRLTVYRNYPFPAK
ncbi:hypothetical protein [Moraxella nasicaprae]|uniref:Uncharacterized protein n=1 Tax=Moraxella nasicaprae TaxID=2904122 RepID=A0ABY6F3E4_9GAMM|nr:hypothetical protein [Moraxella nasicaprae]UXZ04549.1 hypothetical protein LU297_08180 [Moraxella nasicaprae]